MLVLTLDFAHRMLFGSLTVVDKWLNDRIVWGTAGVHSDQLSSDTGWVSRAG